MSIWESEVESGHYWESVLFESKNDESKGKNNPKRSLSYKRATTLKIHFL